MVDLQAAGEHGIPVANVPDFCIDEVSDSTIGFIYDLSRRHFVLDRYVRAGGWGSTTPHPLLAAPAAARPDSRHCGPGQHRPGRGEQSQRPGRETAGPRSLSHRGTGGRAQRGAGHTGRPVAALGLSSACIARSTPRTRGLIGAAQLALMKPTACLINMARGPVVRASGPLRSAGEPQNPCRGARTCSNRSHPRLTIRCCNWTT